MGHTPPTQADRRMFLKTGALAAVGTSAALAQQINEPPAAPELPRRKLGKTGVELTMLEQGAIRGAAYDRILRHAFAAGIRVFDAAKAYGTEPNLKRWFEQSPEVRKQIFLVTKDLPGEPRDMIRMLDDRLKSLGTDYIDLFCIHGLGDDHGTQGAINLVKSRDFKDTADSIRKSGKAHFVGFSTHHKDRSLLLQAAAQSGAVDAIMLQYTPWLDKDSPLNKGLDACWKAGIGLITMKQIAGQFFGDKPRGNILDDVVKKVPLLKERNLSPFQGLLHAIWTDERITASCVSMRNIDQIRENCDAARRYQPVSSAQIEHLKEAAINHGPTLCADCDGRCSAAAHTTAALGDLTRFLTYHQHLGDRAEARRCYKALSPEARDWSTADLHAAQQACPNRLDFARLLPEVDRHLA